MIQISVIEYCSREITALARTAVFDFYMGPAVVVGACSSLEGPSSLARIPLELREDLE